MSIAAASILAKTYRDEIMYRLHEEFPHYGWITNKGYPTEEHRNAIAEHGSCRYHRKSFTLLPPQLSMEFEMEDGYPEPGFDPSTL
jgi:ribonuclease HII